MQLKFVKRAGKFDTLVIQRTDGSSETIECPKQGIIPHDMIHFAVESVLLHRGFLSLVRDGRAPDFKLQGGDSEAAVERLVEVFQAEMWGSRVPIPDLLATYQHACDARGHAAVPVDADGISAIRERLEGLSREWEKLSNEGVLTVSL